MVGRALEPRPAKQDVDQNRRAAGHKIAALHKGFSANRELIRWCCPFASEIRALSGCGRAAPRRGACGRAEPLRPLTRPLGSASELFYEPSELTLAR